MPLVQVLAGGDVQVQGPGLLHPVLDVSQSEDQVDGGEEQQDQEAQHGAEQQHRGGEAGEETPTAATARAGTGTGTAGQFGHVQSPVGSSAPAPLRIGESLRVGGVVVPSLETAVQRVSLHVDSLHIRTVNYAHRLTDCPTDRVNIIPRQSPSPGLGDGVEGGVSRHEGGEDVFLSLAAHSHGVGNYSGRLLLCNSCH